MSSFGNPIPPDPTNDLLAGAPDQISSATYTAQQDLDDLLNWMKTNATDLGKTMGSMWDNSQLTEKALGLLAEALAWIVTRVATVEAEVLDAWVKAEANVYQGAVAPLTAAAETELQVAVGLILQAMSGTAAGNPDFGTSGLAPIAMQMFNEFVQPFTLMTSGLDPSQVGNGIKAQQYLLSKALTSNLQEWVVEQLGNHLGMGFFRTLSPFLGIIDRSVHPSNIVRQAMDSSMTFLLKAPLTRDLNRQYPIKDLGVTALAHMYLRGIIDQPTYLDKCLDSGLNNTWANQLILETARLLGEGDVATLLNLGYVTQDAARQYLKTLGYQPADVEARLYLDTHKRYFTLQERVATEAVSAAKKGYIDQTRLEQLLQQLGYTSDEIALLEIELQFTKQSTTREHLTYGQAKALYEANIIGIDDVITFLQLKGYSDTEVIDLVLLDFTEAEQRAARQNALVARLRVTAAADLVSATSERQKNEVALATAKEQLAAELNAEAAALGTIPAVPGALSALGVLP